MSRALRTGDKLAIVAFDHQVTVPLRMTTIDAEGKGAAKAREAINGIHVGGTTNLSGGLLQGCDLLLNKPETGATATRAAPTRAPPLRSSSASASSRRSRSS